MLTSWRQTRTTICLLIGVFCHSFAFITSSCRSSSLAGRCKSTVLTLCHHRLPSPLFPDSGSFRHHFWSRPHAAISGISYRIDRSRLPRLKGELIR